MTLKGPFQPKPFYGIVLSSRGLDQGSQPSEPCQETCLSQPIFQIPEGILAHTTTYVHGHEPGTPCPALPTHAGAQAERESLHRGRGSIWLAAGSSFA